MKRSQALHWATLLALGFGLGAFLLAGWRVYATSQAAPTGLRTVFSTERMLAVEGRELRASITGAEPDQDGNRRVGASPARIIYVFHTGCPACVAQHAHMGRLLESARDYGVRSISVEQDSIIRGYWKEVGAVLPTPSHVAQDDLIAGRILSVPSVLFLDSDAKAYRAWVGSMRSWTPERFHQELNAAIDASP